MKTITLLIIFSFSLLFANYIDIPVTLDPNNPTGNYGDLEGYHSILSDQPARFAELSRSTSPEREEGGVLVVVEENLYPQIQNAISVYLADLTAEGYDTYLLQFGGGSAVDLRTQIIFYYLLEEITGVVMIGDLPFAVFEMFEDFNNNGIWDPEENWVNFPCDLYFADLDGFWEDTDNNGAFDLHHGHVHPELFVGRIKADNLSFLPQSEAELINSYFARNHLYRNGFISFPSTALAYIDDDWSYWGNEYVAALELLYSDIILINEINATTAGDYREIRLQENYEFIQVHVHSGPDAHHFYENNGGNTNLVTNYQISNIQPNALFYNLFACSNSRYSVPNNMGAMYIYGNGSCFATIGATKTGSMLFFDDFYGPLGQRECLGEALRLWWIENVDVGDDWMWQRSWFYGNIVQGDPTLKLQFESDLVIHIPADYPTIQEGIIAAEDGDIVLVQPGIYVENINFMGKEITVGSLYYTTEDTTYISQTIIDGDQSGSVVTFNSGETDSARLTGFTITNGLNASATFGGGGIAVFNSSSPTLDHLQITANYAAKGGGIYAYDSAPFMSDLVIFANEAPNTSGSGGGLYLMNCDEMLIQNTIITDNYSGGHGSAVIASGCDLLRFENSVFAENETGYTGVGNLFFQNSSVVFMNSVISNNSTQSYAGTVSGGDNVTLINCIVYGNSEPQLETEHIAVYSLIEGGFPGIGNIDSDPLFVDPIGGDFHLQDTSPCLGTGIDEIEIGGNWYYAPEFDLEGNPRPAPDDSMPDLGAYENPLGEPQVEISNNQLPITDLQMTNYPNPFNPSTTISFSLTTEITEDTELKIYNLKGQIVKILPVSPSQSHQVSVIWDGIDENNQPVSSGIYFARLKSGKIEASCKMILLK